MTDAVDVDDADTVAAGRHAVHGDDKSASSPPAPPPPARCLSDLESSPGLRRRWRPTSTPSSPSSSPSSASLSGDGAGLETSSSDDGAPVSVRAVDFGASYASAARRDDPDDGLRASSGLGATWSDDDDDGGGGYDVGIDEHAAGRRSDGNGNGVVRLPRRGFWRSYDTVIMLSICSVVGIVIRMMSATWFRLELGAVFSEDSALGTNLPLNVWSCFLLGLLCSGRDAMSIVHSKVLGGANPHGSGWGILQVGIGAYRGIIDAGRAGIDRARGRGNVRGNHRERCEDDGDSSPPSEEGTTVPGLHRRRGNGRFDVAADSSAGPSPPIRERGGDRMPDYAESIAVLLGLDDEFRIAGSDQSSEDEIRQVQLRGLSRRILASPSIAFFPARKEANDVLEHYESESFPSYDSRLEEVTDMDTDSTGVTMCKVGTSEQPPSGGAGEDSPGQLHGAQYGGANNPSESQPHPQRSPPLGNTNDSSNDVYRKLSEIGDHVATFRRIQFLEGWNSGTSPEEMKHIILLGLRLGFCGALGTFSSLNASVIRLLKSGKIGEALVGYAVSIQLGIVSYRFGQHLAVYIFVWRCRLETKRDERRGYGLRLRREDSDEERGSDATTARTRYISVRSLATMLFVAMFVSLGLSLYFFPSHQKYFISLLFTPFGCLARWKLMTKYNKYLPGFPLGTFACNIGGCALSGSLKSLLAGNPASEESIIINMIAGFAGALSTFSAFIVEILSLVDPIIFKFDGMVYAMITVLWAVIVGVIGSQAKNWADEI